MKKTMTKIFALVLVLAMVIGFVAMIPAQAAEIDSVVVAYHNVYFEDYLQIMYAVYVPDGKTIESIKLSDGTNEFAAVPYSDDKPIPQYNDKDCQLFVAATGVSLQNIDTVVTAEVYVEGQADAAATDTYSVLEYLHKRLTVDDLTGKDAEKAMYESLLDTAEKMQTVINGGVTLHDTSYVHVTNGTIDGINADGMVAVGQTLSGVTCDLIPGENQEVVWIVTEYDDAGVEGVSVEKTTAEVQAIEVEEGVNLTLVASLKDADAPETGYFQVTDLANLTSGEYIIAVNNGGSWYAMNQTFGTKIAATELAVSDGKVTSADVSTLTLTVTVNGTTVNISNGSKYLGYGSSGTNLTQPTTAYNWTIAAGSEAGAFVLNATTGSNRVVGYQISGTQFGGYSTTNSTGYIFDLCFFKLSDGTTGEPEETLPEVTECAHANTTKENDLAATCTDAGYIGATTCDDCGATVIERQAIAATGEHIDENGDTLCDYGCGTTVGGGDVDDTPITASKTIAELITEYGWTSSTTKQTFNLDENVTVKINGGSNTGKAYDGDHIRIYATDTPAGTMTISVPEGYELVSVKVSTQTGTYAYLYVDGTTTDISNEEVAVSGNSVLLNSVKNGSNGKQVRVTAIEVVYKATAAASSLCVNEIATPVSCKEWF